MENYHEQSALLTPDKIQKLSTIFHEAWGKETAHPSVQEIWTSANKALGQCAVTALYVQELYGGVILDDNTHNHMWNLLPDGTQHDFSRSQFEGSDETFVVTSEKSRDEVLNSEKALRVRTPERYALLKEKLS